MGWVGSGKNFHGLGWVQKCWVGFQKSDPWQLWLRRRHNPQIPTYSPMLAISPPNLGCLNKILILAYSVLQHTNDLEKFPFLHRLIQTLDSFRKYFKPICFHLLLTAPVARGVAGFQNPNHAHSDHWDFRNAPSMGSITTPLIHLHFIDHGAYFLLTYVLTTTKVIMMTMKKLIVVDSGITLLRGPCPYPYEIGSLRCILPRKMSMLVITFYADAKQSVSSWWREPSHSWHGD